MFDLLDQSLGFVINRAALALKKELEHALRPYGITGVQFAILKRLWEEDGLSQKEIAERTFKNGAEITLLIDRLAAKELVIRERDETDRRAYRIFLTDKAKGLEHDVVEKARTTLAKALGGVSDADARAAFDVLVKIHHNLG